MNYYRDPDADKQKIAALYDDLLCHDAEYLAALKDASIKAKEGFPTGIILQSMDNDNNATDFEVVLPKYAITIIAARTGGGKTTTMVDLGVRLAMRGHKGIYVTLEEAAHEITAKMMMSYSVKKQPQYSAQWLTRRDAMDVLSGQKTFEIVEPFKRDVVRKCRVIDANKTVDLDKVETPNILYYPQYIANLIEYRNAKSGDELDFVLIDFGQLLESMDGSLSSFERIRSVMQSLKNLSGRLGLAVIVGAQMKRECMGVDIWDWEPEHLRDGSDMEQAANLIIAIGKDAKEADPYRQMALRFLKNRNGPKRVAGMVDLNFANCHIPDKGSLPSNG